jgi:hypothetical protein
VDLVDDVGDHEFEPTEARDLARLALEDLAGPLEERLGQLELPLQLLDRRDAEVSEEVEVVHVL